MNYIKDLRKQQNLTQVQASELVGIPLRTYKVYENDAKKIGSIKYNFIVNCLEQNGLIDEKHGILSLGQIRDACQTVFEEYKVDYCILFGSYARGQAKQSSDVDLLISTEVTGLRFYGLVDKLRIALKKRVDLLDFKQLTNNLELCNEIMRDGIRIYEQK